MRRLILVDPVRIGGRDFWGRRAEVILEPVDQPGWFWRVGGEDVPIRPSLVHCKKRYLMLRHGEHALRVFEHLGALRALGLDAVRIVATTAWLPYDGCALMFWEAIQSSLAEDGRLHPMATTLRESVFREDGAPRRLNVKLGASDSLRISVRVSYPKWGEHEITRIPTSEDARRWRDIIAAKPLARPPWLRRAARAAAFFGWPHYHGVLWPQEVELKALLDELARHRILDLLGALGTLPAPGEYLTGEIETDLADHAADVALLRKLG